MFKPTKPADEMVRAIMVYNDCDDFLEIGSYGNGIAVMWEDCRIEAEQYVAARCQAHPLRIFDEKVVAIGVAVYMLEQCVAYAYALDMGAA